MSLGTGTSHTSAVVDVSYNASSNPALNQMELLFTGFTQGTGAVAYDEKIFEGSNNLLAEMTAWLVPETDCCLFHKESSNP